MRVLAVQTPCQLVGQRFAHKAGTSLQQRVNSRRVPFGIRSTFQPNRRSCAGLQSRHIEQVFDRQRVPAQRAILWFDGVTLKRIGACAMKAPSGSGDMDVGWEKRIMRTL